jgi:putative peptidoglycan lipid II flippase
MRSNIAMNNSKGKRALNIILVIICVNIGSKLLGFIRDAIIGSKFGAGISSDAYYMGLNTTTIIFLSLGSAIATTIIPIVVKIEKNKDKDKILSSIFNSVCLLSAFVGIIYMIFTPELVKLFAEGFTGEKLHLTVLLTRIMIPSILFISLAYIYVGLLQSHEHYILPTIISIPYNLLIIGYLFIGMEKYGIKGLAIVTLIGWITQMAMQIPKVHKVVGLKYTFKIDFKNTYVKEFLIGIIPIVLITATQQINVLSDNHFVSRFGDGKVTALYYASILFTALVTTVVYGITAVMFPKFNKKFVEIDKSSFYATISKVLEGIVLLLIPISVALILVSQEVISIIFMRGEFLLEDVKVTSTLLICYSTFMLAFGIWDVLNKAFYTMGKKLIPMFISISIVVLNYIMNIILVNIFGLKGIVIGTSIAFYIGIFISLITFRRIGGILDHRNIIITTIKALISVSLMAAGVIGFNMLFSGFINVDSNSIRLLMLIGDGIIGIIIYFIGLIIIREKNIVEFIQAIKNKNKKEIE